MSDSQLCSCDPKIGRAEVAYQQPIPEVRRAGDMSDVTLPDLTLWAFSLFSKFGFGDGGVLLDWLESAEDASGEDYRELIKSDYHQALRDLVRQHLVPLIPGEFTTYDITTSHNPIRIGTWRGQEWDDHADNAPPEVEHIGATIPGADVLAVLSGLR